MDFDTDALRHACDVLRQAETGNQQVDEDTLAVSDVLLELANALRKERPHV